MIQNYLVDPALNAYFIKGTTGNANGLIEYVCEAAPGVATSESKWRIKKLIYDSSKFCTHVQWASGNNSFNKEADEYSSYTYS